MTKRKQKIEDKKFWAGAVATLFAISLYVDLNNFRTQLVQGSTQAIIISLGIVFLIWMLLRRAT